MTANMPTCVVNAKFHPMLSDVARETAAQGETVQQIIDRLGRKNGVNQWYCKKVYVELNGTPLLPAAYDRTIVKGSDQLVIQYNIPEGGDGKNPLKTILMLVVAVVATITQQHYITAGMYGAAFGVAVAAAGAMYAINALIPPEGLSNTGLGHADADKTNVYSITGMRNYTPHYKALPLVLGRVRYAPPYGALPYTISQGNDQYLYVDFVHGHGPLLIEDPRLGETALDQFEGVTVASRQGYATDTPLKLMPNDVYPDSFGADVVNGYPVIRTTQIDTEQSIVELVFAQGLFKINAETGERESATVKLVVWTSPTQENNWSIQEIKTITNQAAYPLRTSVTINHSPAGQYDIKVDRETLETNDKTYDTATFAELKSIKFTDPVTFPVPIAETQLIIKGTDQLNGIIDNYNCWHTSICMDYEYTTGLWVKRATNNPASLYRHVLTSNCTSRPVALSKIDLDALEEWHDFCRIKGFKYNRVHDTSEPVPQIIRKICAAGRAMLVNPDGNWSVIIEMARTLGPVQMFTPVNSRKLSSKKTFSDVLHGYRITFNNEESDNQEDELIAYAYGYDQTNSHIFEALQFPGVTKAYQVKELAKYHHAARRYRSELFSWEADWEHLACSRGDMVSVAHDCILVSQATGRIKSIDVPTRTIVLDQAITVQSQTNYGLRIRTTPEGTEYSEIFTQLVYAQFPNWTTDTLTYTGALPATVRKGDVYAFGEIGKEAIEVILTSKRPGKDMTATLTGVQYAWPEIEAYLAGEYPTLNSGVSSPVFTSNQTPPPPTIEYISTGASSAATNQDGSTLQRITVILSVPPGYRVAVDHFEGEISTADGWVRSSSNQNPIIFNNVLSGDHDLRFRSVSALGVTSAWVYRTVTQILGTPPPEPIVSLSVVGKLFQNDLEWVLPADYRSTYRIEIYCSAGVNNRINAKRVALLSGGTVWAHTGLSQKVEYYYWMRVVDNSNPPIYSDWYPLAIFGGIAASPITDPELVLDMLGESITKGQLAAELTAEIEDSGEKFSYLEQFLGNTYTVKIQENGDNPYVVGMGMVIYENWVEGDEILAGEYRWMDSRNNVYKALADHTSSVSNQPPLSPWEIIPYGAKSSFAIVADQFSVSLPDGNGRIKPFITGIDGLLGIDGNLVVAGTIYSIALSTEDAYVITLTSANYVAGVSGYLFDSINGLVEINDFDILINYNSQVSNKPTTLAAISVTEAEKLASIEALATVGATWGSNLAGQPADDEIMNDILALSIAQSYVDQTTYQAKITEIEGLLDGSISTWFYDYAPTLTNFPASDWTTTALKDIHLGDLFYYQSGGTSHRFSLIGGVYQWVTVVDSGVSEALAIANAAQDTADSKRRVFVVQPVPPYDIGDLWDAGGTPRITKRCSVNKAAGTAYAAGDWLVLANAVTSTSQITDGAGLGTKATWDGVTGTGKPANGADVTGSNTSYDTARVGGTAATTIRDNSLAAITATTAMEADSKFSIAEKRTWQIQWPGMSANYDAVRSAALLVDVSVTALDTAKTTLYNFLNTTHAVFATTPTTTTLVQGDLKTKVAAFYTAMSNVVSDTSAASLANTSNLCENSQFYDFPRGWRYGQNAIDATSCTYGVNYNSSYQLIGGNTVYAFQPDGNSLSSTYLAPIERIPAQAGKKYGFSAYTGALGCTVSISIAFYNSNGENIGSTTSDHNYTDKAGGSVLSSYKRLLSSGIAPVGTASMWPFFRKNGTASGSANSFMFATMAMLTEFADGQTIFPAWSPTANERADKTGDAVDAGVDTTTGGLIVRDASTGDYAHLHAGDLNFYYQQSGLTHLYQSVNRLESGTVNHGDTLWLPGIWKKPPRISLSPAALQTYSPALGSAQSQSLIMSAYNVVETSPGSRVYKFTAWAVLSTTPTNYAFTHASLTSLDTGGTAAAATASGINSVSTIQPNAGAVLLSSGPITCVTYCGDNTHWILARIQINFVCAGVSTLIYNQLSTPKWHQDNQTITTTVPALSAAIIAPGGAILRYGYFTVTVQALGNQDYDGYGNWEAVTGSYYFRATVTVPSLKTEYTMPGGSSVAAGRMNYLAIGE